MATPKTIRFKLPPTITPETLPGLSLLLLEAIATGKPIKVPTPTPASPPKGVK